MNFLNIPTESFQLINTFASKYPQAKSILDDIDAHLNQRLWHQLADDLLKFSSIQELQNGTDLIQLYNGIIVFIETALNPMKLLMIAQKILSNYKGKMNEGLIFIENIQKKIKLDGEEKLYVEILKGYCYLNLNRLYDLEDTINSIKSEFESKSEIDPIIYSNFYHLATYFYEKRENYDEFYLSSFQYLAYTKDISQEEKLELCYNLGVSSLIGDKMFNFAELIDKNFLSILNKTPYEWVYNLILSFNSANVTQFLSMVNSYSSQISMNKLLNGKIPFLEMKIRIATLLDLIFQKNKNERTILFKEIMEHCKVEKNQIEYIVMKACTLGLIKGVIDQVEEKVIVTWVQPKYLDREKIEILKNRFDNWIVKANKVLTQFQETCIPLINS